MGSYRFPKKMNLLENKTELFGRGSTIQLRLKRRIKLKNATQCDWEFIDIEMKINLLRTKLSCWTRKLGTVEIATEN